MVLFYFGCDICVIKMETVLEQTKREERPKIRDKFTSHITTLVAGILPFMQSIPPLAIWGALMTIPLITYIALLLTSPNQFFEALLQLFFGGFLIETIVAVIGLAILVYSFIFMRLNKKEGLIRTGPYSLVRHPQYFGVILFITTLTSRSYWLITNTFGIGWLSPQETIALWLGTLVAYIVLAQIEELHLMKKFGEDYSDYKRSVGFIIPYIKSENKWSEIFETLIISAIIFIGLVYSFYIHILIPRGPMPGPDHTVAPFP
jgi:protein-S-isoprenylcysteine O-methyltransferase Ste14